MRHAQIVMATVLISLTNPISYAADESATAAPTKNERRVCKTVAATGTRIAKRTCLTVAQWEEAQKIAQDAIEKSQTSSLMINKEGG